MYLVAVRFVCHPGRRGIGNATEQNGTKRNERGVCELICSSPVAATLAAVLMPMLMSMLLLILILILMYNERSSPTAQRTCAVPVQARSLTTNTGTVRSES